MKADGLSSWDLILRDPVLREELVRIEGMKGRHDERIEALLLFFGKVERLIRLTVMICEEGY